MDKKREKKKNGPFLVKTSRPDRYFTKVPNEFIDNLMYLLKPNEVKLALLFLRSKDDYFFTVAGLAKKFGTSRQNMQNQLKGLKEKNILRRHIDGFELNLDIDSFDLKMQKSGHKINRLNGKEKAIGTKKKKKEEAISGALKNNASPVLNNNAPQIGNNNDNALNNNATPALKDNAVKIDLKSSETIVNKGMQNDAIGSYKTIDNKTTTDIDNINNDFNNSNVDISLTEGNSLEIILQNFHFNAIFEGSNYAKYDITNFSDRDITQLVIDKILFNRNTKNYDPYLLGYFQFLVKYSLNEETPDNNLKKELHTQLSRLNYYDELSKFMK